MFARGDVDDGALVVAEATVGVADGARVLRDPRGRAVPAVDLGLEFPNDVVLFEQATKRRPPRRVDVELTGDVGEPSDQLVGRVVAIDTRQCRVGAEVATIGSGLEDPLDRVLENAAVLRLGDTASRFPS